METFEQKKQRNQRLAAMTFKIAAAFLSEPISDKSRLILSRLFGCMAELDAHVDLLPKNEMQPFAASVLRYLGDENAELPVAAQSLQDSLRNLRNDLYIIPVERKSRFLEEAELIFEKGRTLSQTTNVDVFVRERRAEGVNSANLVVLLIDEFARSPRFHDFYMKAGAAANLVDLMRDARDDYKSGETAIKPSVELYFKLAKHCLRLSAAAIFMHPRKVDLLSALGDVARPLSERYYVNKAMEITL